MKFSTLLVINISTTLFFSNNLKDAPKGIRLPEIFKNHTLQVHFKP